MPSKASEILERELKVVGRSVHIRFYPMVVEHGEGPYLYDVDSKKYLDFNASWAVANTGYGHPKIVEAFVNIYKKLTALSFTTFSGELVVELAEKLVAITQGGLLKKFYSATRVQTRMTA